VVGRLVRGRVCLTRLACFLISTRLASFSTMRVEGSLHKRTGFAGAFFVI
jgi:hypothetical protein